MTISLAEVINVAKSVSDARRKLAPYLQGREVLANGYPLIVFYESLQVRDEAYEEIVKELEERGIDTFRVVKGQHSDIKPDFGPEVIPLLSVQTKILEIKNKPFIAVSKD